MYDKKFLERQLKIWKETENLNPKWKTLVDGYKEKKNELIDRLTKIKGIFEDDEIRILSDTFQDYYTDSKSGDKKFFQLFENKEVISKVFIEDDFENNIKNYETMYICENVKGAREAFLKNMSVFDNDVMKSFHAVGKENKSDDNLKHNKGKSKGAMLQYLIIEYIFNKVENIEKEKLIKFYDLSMSILWTPHSMRKAMGLRYNVNNNNFVLHLLDFYIKISDVMNTEWYGYLNAKWPKKESQIFYKFNTASAIELYSWIHLGDNINDGIVSIYNNKTIEILYALMNDEKNKKTLDYSEFYDQYKIYIDNHKPYPESCSDSLEQVLYADQFFQYISELINKDLNLFKNIIYHGAPGTGKTFELKQDIEEHLKFYENGKFEFIQFHGAYYYEDFIGGLKPMSGEKLNLEYKNGIFKELCREAAKYEIAYYKQMFLDKGEDITVLKDTDVLNDIKIKKELELELPDGTEFFINTEDPILSQFPSFFILIDEINRADLSKVFGELLYAIEDDYRGFENKFKLSNSYMESEETAIYTEDDEHFFFVPKNLYIRGTMNDIDKSVDSIDFAFRRRFMWVEKKFEKSKIKDIIAIRGFNTEDETFDKYYKSCDNLNNKIVSDISIADESHKIGHAIFSNIVKYIGSDNKISEDVKKRLFENHIEAIIYNYLKMDYGHEVKDLKVFKEVFTK